MFETVVLYGGPSSVDDLTGTNYSIKTSKNSFIYSYLNEDDYSLSSSKSSYPIFITTYLTGHFNRIIGLKEDGKNLFAWQDMNHNDVLEVWYSRNKYSSLYVNEILNFFNTPISGYGIPVKPKQKFIPDENCLF